MATTCVLKSEDLYYYDKNEKMMVKMEINSKFQKISEGYLHKIALDKDGNLHGFGCNDEGQLGLGNKDKNIHFDERIGALLNVKFTDVCCGYYFTIAIDSNGKLWSWGDNSFGQLGLGHETDAFEPTQINFDKEVKMVVCGTFSFYVLDSNGNIWSCGGNDHGELGLGDCESRSVLTMIESKTQFVNIFSSAFSDCLFAMDKKSNVYFCGTDLRETERPTKNSLTLIFENSPLTDIFCGDRFVEAVDSTYNRWVLGDFSLTFHPDSNDHKSFFNNFEITDTKFKIKKMICGHEYSLVLDLDGLLWGRGTNEYEINRDLGKILLTDVKYSHSYTKIEIIDNVDDISSSKINIGKNNNSYCSIC